MSPERIKQRILSDRIGWIHTMVANIRRLPLHSYEEFTSDNRNTASAESYLRRALEALFDLGRHLLAKGFGIAVIEYKQIAAELYDKGVLDKETVDLLTLMAGYRNRMVHYYNEISEQELYEICCNRLTDIEKVVNGIIDWTKNTPDKIDTSL